jgi:hypothetical protein
METKTFIKGHIKIIMNPALPENNIDGLSVSHTSYKS